MIMINQQIITSSLSSKYHISYYNFPLIINNSEQSISNERVLSVQENACNPQYRDILVRHKMCCNEQIPITDIV